ncbi:MAG TPA: PHP domain-containing protein [Gemmataceae bacterium]|nr:PHP domain-containing protein [Gemmataceae bacterium]
MPAGQPFTALCQLAARGPYAGRVDLHVHTTHSDGAYTPAQVVDLARRAGLAALAVTDHDTLGGVQVARAAAAGSGVEIVAGVEITTEHRHRELHLLGYFVALDHIGLTAALADIRRHRRERFREMIERLRGRGVSLDGEEQLVQGKPEALGRRHLAEMLVRARRVATVREAFARYLGDRGGVAVPKKRLPVAEALILVREAGGVAAWAHPAYDCTQEQLTELRALGLGAIEVEYPDVRRSRGLELRGWAGQLGLAVTGGSDCHGPGRRCVGSSTISAAEFMQLRQRVSR